MRARPATTRSLPAGERVEPLIVAPPALARCPKLAHTESSAAIGVAGRSAYWLWHEDDDPQWAWCVCHSSNSRACEPGGANPAKPPSSKQAKWPTRETTCAG